MVNQPDTAAHIIERMFREADEVLKGAGRWVGIAFVFSGQGAQYPGMGRDLYEASPAAREIFDLAESLRPGTLSQCFSGTKEELSQTINTQPCLFAMDLASSARRWPKRA